MVHGNDPPMITSLIAGGVAGTTVDTTLFPLDTLKTRLQSPRGFLKSGGFHRLYNGIGPVLLGSAPTAALFFCTYNTIKGHFHSEIDEVYYPLLHMVAASGAEVVSCLVKVPTEILKQRQQVGLYTSGILAACSNIYSVDGLKGFYRGLASTIIREIPFSVIQFPIWEMLMYRLQYWRGCELSALDKALCGAVAGGTAAAITTPVDVAKTRIMLEEKNKISGNYKELRVYQVLSNAYAENGVRGLFAGFLPRTMWITLGGAIFFGSYEVAKDVCNLFI